MRVGIIGLLQESNTFIGQPTTLDHFRNDLLLRGEPIRQRLSDAPHEIGGFFEALADAAIEAVPVFVARALPFGAMTGDTYRRLREMMLTELAAAGRLDGVLAACHGANVAESVADVDGDWLSAIRNEIGPQRPLIGTLDPHGNLSPAMVAATDALIAYRTNPHIDQRQRGAAAGSLMARTLRGEVRPTQAASFPPLVINIERQETARPPLARHFAAADEQLQRPGVLANSIMLGFPYADVEEMGCATIAVTDGNRELAQRLATEMARRLWRERDELIATLLEVPAALEMACRLDGPVCLLDMGDNVGGGSPGDGTVLVRAIVEHASCTALACLCDPQAVREAEAAGVGGTIRLAVGGKTDALHGDPLEATFTVRGLYEGRFRETRPRHGGFTEFDQGRSAVVATDDGLTLLLNSRRMAPFSLEQLRSCEIDPTGFDLLVVKGVHAPLAAYEEVCGHFLRVNTPGVTTADLSLLEYRHRRRPLFPLERDCPWPEA